VFVFSRRAIQRCIDELREALSDGQLEGLVKRLNRVGRDRFATSWEVCLLHSLSRVGTVLHEVPLPGGRKPDISFTYPGENAVGFIADVTAHCCPVKPGVPARNGMILNGVLSI
jgi:hypothetical protein